MKSEGARTLAVYVIAGIIYITISVFFPRLILSIFEGIAFLFLMIWLIPRVVRGLR
jgi:hypothetical protein